MRETLGFGQVAIFLVTAAVLDSMPGPTVFRRRLLPEGWLTGVATAVKLTPAVVAVYNFFAGKRREGVVSFLEKRPAVYPDQVSTNMPDFFPWYGPRHYE